MTTGNLSASECKYPGRCSAKVGESFCGKCGVAVTPSILEAASPVNRQSTHVGAEVIQFKSIDFLMGTGGIGFISCFLGLFGKTDSSTIMSLATSTASLYLVPAAYLAILGLSFKMRSQSVISHPWTSIVSACCAYSLAANIGLWPVTSTENPGIGLYLGIAASLLGLFAIYKKGSIFR